MDLAINGINDVEFASEIKYSNPPNYIYSKPQRMVNPDKFKTVAASPNKLTIKHILREMQADANPMMKGSPNNKLMRQKVES